MNRRTKICVSRTPTGTWLIWMPHHWRWTFTDTWPEAIDYATSIAQETT